ncbi:hypothetical protein QOZ80_2AG0101810 [Eleusine coracana subsp. coracana]|nr:hypothetical protein QOZ80_2AG0101810 [Eleusine coracana subsp. coracana]
MASGSGVKGEEFANSEANMKRESMDAFCGDADDCRKSVDTKQDACTDVMEVTHGEKGARKVTEDVVFLCGEGPPPSELSDDEEGEVTDDEEFASLEDDHNSHNNHDYHGAGDVDPMYIFPHSRHRDGSIYMALNFCIARFEAMKLSDPEEDCKFVHGNCMMHSPRRMLQIFSLKLAKIPMDGGPIELYGYIAARDILEPLLNYVVKFCRDEPIIVQQGSLIEMTGPKRGIELYDTTLIEYDMRIKAGEKEKDDLQLIDGVSMVHDLDMFHRNPFTRRILGDCGAVDITVSRLDEAVEATVEVAISEVCSSFNLSLSCFISGLCEEIRLFDGTVGTSCGLRRSVVAVVKKTWMDLKFKVQIIKVSFVYLFQLKSGLAS